MFGHVGVTRGSHGAIANDVLLRYRLVLDYPHARLFADPSGRPPDSSASAVRIGVAVRFEDDRCPKVRQVTDTNAVESRARIHPGDVIVSVDGRDTCTMFHHELAGALAGTPGTIKKLRLRRGGTTIDAEVPIVDLFGPPP
jgi:C-terminal processing protease CtpA/Prc